MNYKKQEIIENLGVDGSTQYQDVVAFIYQLLNTTLINSFIVWDFHKAPELLRNTCKFNGGDEDWLIVTTKDTFFYQEKPMERYFCSWLEKTDTTGEPDIYEFGEFMVIVGSHA